MTEWIPIDLLDEKAQAPKDRQSVLVCTKDGSMYVAEYQHLEKDTRRGHHQFMERIEHYSTIPVTHWMLLPERPE